MNHLCCLTLVISTLFILTYTPAFAQTNTQTDSLNSYLRTHAPTDTTYVLAQNNYAWQLLQKSDFRRADSTLQWAKTISRRMNYTYGLYQTYYNRGLGLYYQDKSEQALPIATQAMQLANQYHLPPKDRQMGLSLLGVVQFTRHNYEVALRYYLAAIRLTEQYRLTYRVTPAYLGVGNVLRVMGKTKPALDYYRQALVVARQEPEERMVVLAESHMGDALSTLGKSYYRAALQHYEWALPVAMRCGARGPLSDVLTSVGQMNIELGHYATAMHYLKRSEQVCTTDHLTDQHGAVCYSLGQTYQALHKPVLAKFYYEQALRLARQIGDADEIRTRTQKLASFYVSTGRYKEAYEHQQQTMQLNDSLFNSQSARHVQELTTQYQTEKKEQQIRLMTEEARLASLERTSLIAVGILLLLLSGAVSAWLLNRARLRRLEEAQNLRKQIAHDLHDEVGSTLSSISMLSGHTDTLLSQNRPESAQKMVQKIYTDARQILESIDEIIWTINPGNDTLQRIIFRLQEYAQPLMESKNIDFSFVSDPALEEIPISMEVRRNLYLIGKEAINNLVKYSQATEATVRFDKQGHQLQVLIEDNGQGFDATQTSQRTGQTSMQQRAEAIGGRLEVRSEPGHGTRLELIVDS